MTRSSSASCWAWVSPRHHSPARYSSQYWTYDECRGGSSPVAGRSFGPGSRGAGPGAASRSRTSGVERTTMVPAALSCHPRPFTSNSDDANTKSHETNPPASNIRTASDGVSDTTAAVAITPTIPPRAGTIQRRNESVADGICPSSYRTTLTPRRPLPIVCPRRAVNRTSNAIIGSTGRSSISNSATPNSPQVALKKSSSIRDAPTSAITNEALDAAPVMMVSIARAASLAPNPATSTTG